jgi:hypothetical protein
MVVGWVGKGWFPLLDLSDLHDLFEHSLRTTWSDLILPTTPNWSAIEVDTQLLVRQNLDAQANTNSVQ